MKVQELAESSARLSCVTEKSRAEFEKAVGKWFSAQFVTGMKLPLLRAIHQAGAYPIYARMLANARAQDLIAVLGKLDKHRPEMAARGNGEIMRHLEALASGAIDPAPKPKPPPRPRATAKPLARGNGRGRKAANKPVGIFSTSKY